MRTRCFLLFVSLFFLCSCPAPPKQGNTNNSNPRVQNTNRPSSSKSNGNTQNRIKLSGSEVFERYNSAVFMIFTSDGKNDYQGSGFFVSASGIGVSNYHVFDDTYIGMEQIKLVNGKVYKIDEVIAYDEDEDFIVFKIASNGERFSYVPIAVTMPKVGEKAYAIGSPKGLENTFSSGEISQLRDDHWIQISVPIDHGSSGGVLLNEHGEAIGITSAGMDDSGANLNFAKSIMVIRPYL